MKRFFLLLASLAVLSGTGSLLAHHSFAAMFDADKVVELKGVVTEFKWINPHTFVIVDVKGTDGKMERWALEGPAPNMLTRQGLTTTLLKAGDTVAACGYRTKDSITVDPARLGGGGASQVMLAELLTLPGADLPRLWQDYGQHRCRDMRGAGGYRGREFTQ